MDLEQQLRAALQRVDPPDDLYDRVAARISDPSNQAPPLAPRGRRLQLRALAAGLAGTLLLSTLFFAGLRHRAFREEQRAEGERARAEVMLALRITSQKTRLAREAVHYLNESSTAIRRN